jgi:transcriptional regulator with XRE-family HTH domain
MAIQLHITQHLVKPNDAHRSIAPRATILDNPGMQLAKIRKARGLSIRDLADMIGMDPATVQRAETMHSSAKLTTYVRCAEVLGVTLADIFAADRSALELKLVQAFRALPADQHERVLGLLQLAEAHPR